MNSLIKHDLQPDIHTLLADAAILRRKDYKKLLTAQSILDGAAKESDKISERALQAFEAQESLGYAEGCRRAKLEQIAVLTEYSKAMASYMKECESQVVDIIYHSVKKLIGEVSYEEKLKALVLKDLGQLGECSDIFLSVHSEDAAIVREALQEKMPHDDSVKIKIDDTLCLGSFTLSSNLGIASCSIDTHLEHFLENLRSGITFI